MSDWQRQVLAIAALVGGGALAYFWLGINGLCGFGLGVTTALLTLGLASGYWVGVSDADEMVSELMKWRRSKR